MEKDEALNYTEYVRGRKRYFEDEVLEFILSKLAEFEEDTGISTGDVYVDSFNEKSGVYEKKPTGVNLRIVF